MITIDSKKEYDLNNMNVASQNIQLGTYLKELNQIVTGSSGSFALSTITATSGSITNLYSTTASTTNLYAASGSFTAISSGSARFGDTVNYTQISSDGTITMSGSATVWDDLFFPLTTAKQGQTDKPPFSTAEVAYLFPAGDTSHIMYIIVQFPHYWKTGSNIYPHVHWKQESTGSPVFKMDYKWYGLGDIMPANFSTYVMATKVFPYTSGSMQQLNSGSAPISGSHITGVSSLMLVKLYRDDNAYSGNTTTYQFDIHIEKDSLGSKEIYVK